MPPGVEISLLAGRAKSDNPLIKPVARNLSCPWYKDLFIDVWLGYVQASKPGKDVVKVGHLLFSVLPQPRNKKFNLCLEDQMWMPRKFKVLPLA